MKSAIIKHSIKLAGRKTSVSLEEAFWSELKRMAAAAKLSTSQLIASIDRERDHANLSSACRIAVVHHLRLSQTPQPAE
jgi:predicted DNA-binding ribbon-helix-helix protein